jgi:hypothetical protein
VETRENERKMLASKADFFYSGGPSFWRQNQSVEKETDTRMRIGAGARLIYLPLLIAVYIYIVIAH